jgi:hypothetical protein
MVVDDDFVSRTAVQLTLTKCHYQGSYTYGFGFSSDSLAVFFLQWSHAGAHRKRLIFVSMWHQISFYLTWSCPRWMGMRRSSG